MEETRLLQDLFHRLGDLELKVRAYRLGVLTDFERHYHCVLRDVTPAIALELKHAVDSSLLNYPNLFVDSSDMTLLDFDTTHMENAVKNATVSDQVDSKSAPRSTGIHRPAPPQDVFGAAAAAVGVGLGNTHERENELQGLFTPNYLPLLEVSPQLPKSLPVNRPLLPAIDSASAPSSSVYGLATAGQPGGGDMEGPMVRDQGEIGAATMHHLSNRPPNPRRATDDTTSSAASSDKSESKGRRRSALRRSSSSNKNAPSPKSPRRVRFEFHGAEVLPTESPLANDLFSLRASSPIPSEDLVESEAILGDGKDIEEEGLPDLPPRKTSSSEALRALSRAPLDEETVWTVVNPDAEENSVEQKEDVATPVQTPLAPPPAPEPPSTTSGPPPRRAQVGLGSLREHPAEDDSDQDSSDDDFLAMGKPRSFQTKKAIQSKLKSTVPATKQNAVVSPAQSKGISEAPAEAHVTEEDEDQGSSEDFEDDDMFYFESSGLSAPPRPKRRPLSPKEEEAEPSPSAEEISEEPAYSMATYATSPAVPITRPTMSPGQFTPTTSRFQVGSLGSYKGRSVVMPVVKDPEVHAQAASLGQFNTFVGGLDGRSGMDEGDLNSFRASLVHTGFSGTPRSMTERMMMEDAMAERAANGKQGAA